MLRPFVSLSFLITIVLLCGCGRKASHDPVVMVAKDDKKMNEAMAKARTTVNTFIAALKSPASGQSGFAVKVDFQDGSEHEFMWISRVTFDGEKFHGVIDNDPELVKNVKIGQKVSVPKGEIADWMFVQNKKLIGGETLRVLRNALVGKERADLDKSLPFAID